MRSLTEDPFQKEGLLSLMPRTFQGFVRSSDSLDPLDVEAIDNIQRQKILCDISIKEMQKAKEVLSSCDKNFHQQKAIQKFITDDDMLAKFKENIPPDDNFQNARIKREGTGRVSSRRRFSFSSSVLEPVLKVEKNYQELDVSAFFEDAQRREEAEKIKRQMMGEKSPELFSHESQNTRVRRKGTGRKAASKNFVWDPPDNAAKIMETDEEKLCVEEEQKLGITFVGPEKFSDLEAGFKIDHTGCGLLSEGSHDNQNQINVSQELSSAPVDGEASVIPLNDLLSTILASDGSEMHEFPKITNTVENLGSKAMHHELPITLLQGQNDSSDKIILQSCLEDTNDIARLPEYWRQSKTFENRLFSSLNDKQAANRSPSQSPTPSPSELFAALNSFNHVEDSEIANQECDVVNVELERNNNSSSTIYFSEFNAKENSHKQKKICRRKHLSRSVCSEKEDDVDLPCDAFNHSIPDDETPNASANMFDNGLKDENRESRNPLILSTPSGSGTAAAKFSDCHKMTEETANSLGKLFISESVETGKTQDTSSSPLKLSGNTKSNPSRDQNLSSKKKTLKLDCPPGGLELVDNLAEIDKVSHGSNNSTENRKSAVLERRSSIRMKQRLNFDFDLETAESLEQSSSIPITISSTKNSKSKESGSSIPGTGQLSMQVQIEKQEKLLEMVANAPDYMINTDKENQIVPLGHASTSPVDEQTEVSTQNLHRRNVKKVNPTSQDKRAFCPQDNTLNQFVNKEQKNEKRIRRRADCKPRQSLAGAGTFWKSGVRRSTRIRSRPLEYWRGERFLYGRIHESLATVIGIKYTSPLRDGIKSKQLPKFKVESFVDDRYSDLVQFAAKH